MGDRSAKRVLFGACALALCLWLLPALSGCACASDQVAEPGASESAGQDAAQEGSDPAAPSSETTAAESSEPDGAEGTEDGDSDNDAGGAAVNQAAVPSTAGALQVVGSQLCDAAGNPVQLRGVSTHGLAWFPQYVNDDFFQELRQDWGANVVRLAMYTAESGGYCTDGDPTALRQLVLDGVDYASDADLYAIVDWHVLSDQSPLVHADAAEAFFADMSAQLADRDNVLYEICNEPNGSATWDDVVSYANRVIPAIRANDPDAVVIVGTPEWSQRVDQAAASPLDFDNVLYALHFYAATHQQDLRDRMAAAVGAGLPVFVSEFGICDASGNGAVDYESADAWVRLMDSLNVSFVCWNLSNKNETSALFLPDCERTSGFAESDLSDEGRWLREVLRGERPSDGAGEGGEGASVGAGAGATAGVGGSSSTSGAASGALGSNLSGAAGDLAWSATVRQTWEADGKTAYLYDVTISNDGSTAVSGWTVDIPFDTALAISDSWNGAFSQNDGWLTIANVDYNGTLAPGASVTDVGFIATAG